MAADLDPAKLASQRCDPANADTTPLSPEDAQRLASGVDANWIIENDRLVREFRFPTFAAAFGLATRIALLAEAQNHHPAMDIAWGWLRVAWTTDAIGTLSLNDMIMAAKVDRLIERGIGLTEGPAD
jgi:4a-hydroxytetrahydrobiopterin dehydratase